MENMEEVKEYVILIGVNTGDEKETEESIDELEELAVTAGAVTVGKVIQNREAIHQKTYIGKGKIEEVPCTFPVQIKFLQSFPASLLQKYFFSLFHPCLSF